MNTGPLTKELQLLPKSMLTIRALTAIMHKVIYLMFPGRSGLAGALYTM